MPSLWSTWFIITGLAAFGAAGNTDHAAAAAAAAGGGAAGCSVRVARGVQPHPAAAAAAGGSGNIHEDHYRGSV